MLLFRSTSDRQLKIGLTILRVVTAIMFIAHGGQKLFVYGFAGVSSGFAQLGIPFPGLLGPFVALLEFFGGFALILGLLTRLTALGLASTMVVAILTVHLKGGFFLPNGYEFALALLGTTLTLVVTGAGKFSLDAWIEARLAERNQQSVLGANRPSVSRAA